MTLHNKLFIPEVKYRLHYHVPHTLRSCCAGTTNTKGNAQLIYSFLPSFRRYFDHSIQ